MAHGLKVNGLTSIALIDGNYQNFALRHHGFHYLGTPNNNPIRINYRASLSLPVDTPVMAFRSNVPAMIESVSRSGGNLIYNFISVDNPATIEYYLFDRPNYAFPTGSNYGLRVRDPSGNVTYDSRMRYLKIIDGRSAAYTFDQYTESLNDPVNFEQNYSGVKVAVIQVVRPWNHVTTLTDPGPQPTLYEFLLSGLVVNNNDSHLKVYRDVYTGAVHAAGSGTVIDPDSNNTFCYNYQAIDVTGY